METGTIILVIIGVVIAVMVMLYNRLVALRQTRLNAFSDIDVQLKQRFDLVPQLVEVVKGYAKHEQEVLQNVTNARARVQSTRGHGPAADRQAAEGMLGRAMMNLFAVAENYPDLKANENFLHLQTELSDIENKIAAARRFFNNATSEYNISTEQFPSVLIANMFGFKKEAFFELDEDQKDAVQNPPKFSMTE